VFRCALRRLRRGRSILAQNLGARKFDRLRGTMRDALLFVIVYALVVWALMALLAGDIANLFGANNLAREVIVFFCHVVAGRFLFEGAIFIASAAFNNRANQAIPPS
jgi:Na+-driven multidrug efflux pump